MLFAQFAPLWNFFTAALFGHRAARMNFQPDGGLAGLGISPSSFWAFLLLSGSRGGIAKSSALVYGWLGLSKDFRVGEDSTSVPRDITATRSATWAITPRSWVMKRIAIQNPATRSFIRSSTCAWIVTSSAVVGSSAISNLGLVERAMAIITRCIIPPDSSKTKCCNFCAVDHKQFFCQGLL